MPEIGVIHSALLRKVLTLEQFLDYARGTGRIGRWVVKTTVHKGVF